MTQFQFDMICTIIDKGAPALANDLITSLSTVIKEANALAEENAALKAEITRRDSNCEEPNVWPEACDGKCSSCDEKACEVTEG